MSLDRERSILAATDVLSKDFHTLISLEDAEDEDPREVKRKFIETITSLVDSLREKFQVDSEGYDTTNRIYRLVKRDAEKDIFLPLEKACVALANYFQAEYETDFNQYYALTDGDFVLVLIRRLRALRYAIEATSRQSKKPLQSTKIAKGYTSIFVQSINASLQIDGRSFSLSKFSEFSNLSEQEFFSLILEVARVMAGGEITAATEDDKKNVRFIVFTVAAAILANQETISTIKNERFTDDDIEELQFFIKQGEKFIAKFKIILSNMYQLSLKPRLSPIQEQRLTTFSTLLFNMHQDDALNLNSQNLAMLGINKYGDLWKVLRILLRSQSLFPELKYYSLEKISVDLLENIDNEDILSADLSIVNDLNSESLYAMGESSDQVNVARALEEVEAVFHPSRSNLQFAGEKLEQLEVCARYGVRGIVTRKDGQTLELTVELQSTIIKIFTHIKLGTIDWDRLYPFDLAANEEKVVILQLISAAVKLLQETLNTKEKVKLDKPTQPSLKGPQRENVDKATALEFSTPLTVTDERTAVSKESVGPLLIRVTNFTQIDQLFPKKMPEFAKNLIRFKLKKINPKFLKKLDHLIEGKVAYRYKVQSFRVVLLETGSSTQNNFELEAYAVGDRKEIYTNLL